MNWRLHLTLFLCLLHFPTVPISASIPLSTTTLAISANNGQVARVPWKTVVTLTATVTVGGLPVTAGRVAFSEYRRSSYNHLLGTAQIINAGTAAIRFVPGIGSHQYTATFLGTPNGISPSQASASAPVVLGVEGKFPTTVSLTASGSAGNYSLGVTLLGLVNQLGQTSPVGPVSVLDTTNGDKMIASITPSRSVEAFTMQSRSLTVGSTPQGLAVADFNNDGFLDIAITNSGDNTVTILLGNGEGSFSQASESPIIVGNSPRGVMAADFNGDGIADLAIANTGDNSLTILLGRGDGTFDQGPDSPVAVGREPWAIAAADFNRDGLADLVVTNNAAALPGGDGSLTILLGRGDGTFSQAPNSPIASVTGAPLQAMFTAVGDFNDDGIPDLAVTTEFGLLAIFLGNGDGTFTAPYSPLNVGGAPTANAVVVGDFNGDGNADLAVADNACCTFQYSGTISILLGNGTGHFVRSQGLYANHTIYSLAVADFNEDGALDLAVTSFGGSIPNTIFLGSDGPFSLTDVTFPSGITDLVPADLNGDGVSDLVGVSPAGNCVYIMMSNMTETEVGTAAGIAPVGAGVHSVVANYPGDTSFAPSSSDPVQLTGSGNLTATLTVTPSTAIINTAETLGVTVVVTGGAGNPTPTGTVTLRAGIFSSQPTALEGGVASISIPAGSLATGTDSLNADYSGDTVYQSASGVGTVTVTTPPPPGFTIMGTPLTIAPGATAGNTSKITVTPTGGFTGNVILTALITSQPQGAQSIPTLSFGSTGSVNITAGVETATLTVTTIGREATPHSNLRNRGLHLSASEFALICILFTFNLRRQKRGFPPLLLGLVLIGTGLIGCGGSHEPSTGNAGTTSGNYTVTVTGTSGNMVATTSVSLTVK
ncbi:MAG TPA: FG-GAP-like repeat-containing protein [Terracidiphilus sp.]|nr:FG-GAP-like repeat-containing protein [Terracidiphilus sp.]